MKISYASESNVSAEELSDVFRRSGIRRPVDDLARMKKMVESADLLITARDGDLLVGVARSLTDYCYCCYLSDLAVAQEYQRVGIGRELIRLTRESIGEETTLLLLAAPAAWDYYPKVGFERVDNGWIIHRKR